MLRAFNRVGATLRAAGISVVRLDPDILLDRAAKKAGVDDFSDGFFQKPFRRLLDAFEREAALTTVGRLIARNDILRLLENRLRLVQTLKAHPEIGKGEVRRPIFILGLPRTGTTILHELLAQDPSNRVPTTWEVMHPWPPPERATFETDPRIAMVEKHFAGVDRVLPGFKAMHPMGARLPQECVAITAHEFATMLFSTTHRVPSYQAWLDGTDLRPVYESHRRWLQFLEWRCPAERWVLKSPGHLWALDSLLTVYPDARIVQTHRDPLKVVASLASLLAVLRGMASNRIDPFEIGAEWAPRLAAGLERSIDVRDHLRLGADQVFDLHFSQFVGNEIEWVRRIYAHFDLGLSGDAEARMRRFLSENPKEKHGTHRYTLSQAGLDAAAERSRFARYCERFRIVAEAVD